MKQELIIRDEAIRSRACAIIAKLDLEKPWSVVIKPYNKNRSVEQNKLQRRLIKIIADHLGDRTPEEVRGECKLMFGVPILRDENETFREKYDDVVRPLSYSQKLALMMEPLDMPVTRLMTVKQMTKYIDSVYRHYAGLGVVFPSHTDLGMTLSARGEEG